MAATSYVDGCELQIGTNKPPDMALGFKTWDAQIRSLVLFLFKASIVTLTHLKGTIHLIQKSKHIVSI